MDRLGGAGCCGAGLTAGLERTPTAVTAAAAAVVVVVVGEHVEDPVGAEMQLLVGLLRESASLVEEKICRFRHHLRLTDSLHRGVVILMPHAVDGALAKC